MDLDALISKFEKMDNDIADDVQEIVRNNTLELTRETIDSERKRFDQGYWTGHTARNTWAVEIDKLHWMTFVNTDYAGYLEYGTRYYSGATQFLYNPFFKQKQQFKKELDMLMKG